MVYGCCCFLACFLVHWTYPQHTMRRTAWAGSVHQKQVFCSKFVLLDRWVVQEVNCSKFSFSDLPVYFTCKPFFVWNFLSTFPSCSCHWWSTCLLQLSFLSFFTCCERELLGRSFLRDGMTLLSLISNSTASKHWWICVQNWQRRQMH